MRERLTYANVTATIALFLALGLGGAYAAGKITSEDLAKSSVTSKAIENRSVKGKDVKNETLTGVDYRDRSVGPADLTAAAPPVRPTLGNGVEDDCIWVDGTADIPGTAPVSYRMDASGEVSFGGIAFSTNGPGGDATCGPAGAEAVEDETVFTLEPEYRPADTELFINPRGENLIFVVGVDGLSFLGLLELPAGAVVADAQPVAVLNEIRYLSAGAPSAPAPSGGPARIGPGDLRELLR